MPRWAKGIALVKAALRHRPPSRWALMAAIAAVHVEAPRYTDTDWLEIARLYDVLAEIWPSPVVAVNRAIALGEAHVPQAGLDALDELGGGPLAPPPWPGRLGFAAGGVTAVLDRLEQAGYARRSAPVSRGLVAPGCTDCSLAVYPLHMAAPERWLRCLGREIRRPT